MILFGIEPGVRDCVEEVLRLILRRIAAGFVRECCETARYYNGPKASTLSSLSKL